MMEDMNLYNLTRNIKKSDIFYGSIKKYVYIKYHGDQIFQIDTDEWHSHVNVLNNGSYRKYLSDYSNTGHILEDGRIFKNDV